MRTEHAMYEKINGLKLINVRNYHSGFFTLYINSFYLIYIKDEKFVYSSHPIRKKNDHFYQRLLVFFSLVNPEWFIIRNDHFRH